MADGFTGRQTANYSADSIKKLTGSEQFVDGGAKIPVRITDYWQWAYSDLLRNTQRGVLAEFIVKTALDLGGITCNHPMRLAFEPYDLLGPPITAHPGNGSAMTLSRIEVKSAAYLQAWERRHPEKEQKLSFGIAPAKIPDETGDYPANAPRQRNSDLYVFCVFTPSSGERDANILDLGLWRFYVAKTRTVNELCQERKRISLGSKLFSDVTENNEPLRFDELCNAIVAACKTI